MHTAKFAKLPDHFALPLCAIAGALLAATAILCVHDLEEPPAKPLPAKVAVQEQVITIPAPKTTRAKKAPKPRCNPEIRARSLEDKATSKTSKPVRIDDALARLNAMQQRRNARHGCPEHPSDATIEEPLAPGEKMVVDVDRNDVMENLEVIQHQREQRRRRKHMRHKPPRKVCILLEGATCP